ncbi:MAG: hypothetical protein ACI83N_000757, partial [Hydrogenophaga sp.]
MTSIFSDVNQRGAGEASAGADGAMANDANGILPVAASALAPCT